MGVCMLDPNYGTLAATVTRAVGGHLVYKPNARGDTIPDFSNVGYHGGEVSLPAVVDVSTTLTISADPEGTTDDTTRIQAAIDNVSSCPLDHISGFRGAVQQALTHYRHPIFTDCPLRTVARVFVLTTSRWLLTKDYTLHTPHHTPASSPTTCLATHPPPLVTQLRALRTTHRTLHTRLVTYHLPCYPPIATCLPNSKHYTLHTAQRTLPSSPTTFPATHPSLPVYLTPRCGAPRQW